MLEKLSENPVIAADDIAKFHLSQAAGACAEKTHDFPYEPANVVTLRAKEKGFWVLKISHLSERP